MTDTPPTEDQPTPPVTPPPQQGPNFTEAEKRANAARINAYMDLGKITATLLQAAMSIAEIQLPGGKIVVPASPGDLVQLIGSLEQRMKQLEIAINVITEMLLRVDLVAAIDNPDVGKTDAPVSPKLLNSAGINRESYWLMCARQAEATASVLTRGLLSGGGAGGGVRGAVEGILRKPS